jgi:hypothetical protein
MDTPLTWTQFATVIGILTAVATIAAGSVGYLFKQWQDAAFGQILQQLDQIARRLDGIEAKMVTRDEMKLAILELELRLRVEAPPIPPGGATG